MHLSLRWRLAFWNTLALAVVLLGFAVLVYFLLERALYQQTDRTLLAGLQQLEQDERLARDPERRLRYWIDEFKEHENLFCIVYAADGRVVIRSVELAQDSVPAAPTLGAEGRT